MDKIKCKKLTMLDRLYAFEIVKEFVLDNYTINTDKNTNANDVYDDYVVWAKYNRRITMSQKDFNAGMSGLGIPRRKVINTVVFAGITPAK